MNNQELNQRRAAAIPRGIASAAPIHVAKAANAELWDVQGKRYLDFAAGIAVCNTGHCHPRLVEAVQNQSRTFIHTAFQVVPYPEYISLAERLNELAPIPDAKSIFMTTGAEAVENAIKIARHHTGRPGVIAFTGAFHGRSLLTMGLTGKVVPYKAGFGPFPADIYHAPFPVEHFGITTRDSLAALQRLFKGDIEPQRVAAIIVEPVQGEGGFYIAPRDFLQGLRDLCHEHGIILICDEVQSGFGRTGALFACEHYGIEPDLITVAKALAGGFPLSGVIGRAAVMDSPNPGGLGGTYGGSPVGCAAAHAVLDIIAEEELCRRSREIGQRQLSFLKGLKTELPDAGIGDVRGLGAMVAFELLDASDAPAPERARALTSEALQNGLIVLSCGIYGNTIRLLAPLTIPDDHLEEGLRSLQQSLEALPPLAS